MLRPTSDGYTLCSPEECKTKCKRGHDMMMTSESEDPSSSTVSMCMGITICVLFLMLFVLALSYPASYYYNDRPTREHYYYDGFHRP